MLGQVSTGCVTLGHVRSGYQVRSCLFRLGFFRSCLVSLCTIRSGEFMLSQFKSG